MLTFTITTSTKLASISLFENDSMLGNININVRKTHSTSIMDQVSKLFEWTNTNIDNVENVIISTGPGSFTGVRIAMSLIKGIFALSPNVKIYEVSELDALQYMAKNYANVIVAGIDSRKGKIYCNIVENGQKKLEDGVYNIQDIVEKVSKIDKTIAFVGDIYLNYKDIIKHDKLVNLSYNITNINSNVYYDMFCENLLKVRKIEEIVPEYLEKSQAEKDYNNGNT
ncbi:tRNA (adenosine(37)-N6)-threonylcarbamoyltransferase complex dimerization subunit type 1 TsaB [Oceanivirga salmonicida]|uniref:tRNA (adenosine(37)-N6)-threonylcarbamoyltransferase complex dimerization subunit type 1 TsaB n=1 Tax=Oceanivirga salmonicida TaxID=1769291 RepID=UPI0012E2DB28|nr:tRNA (adenosine(37)-N6)-threonylcarbamoyltransferase complex dimerization subunit type 1 TsaB [Oceanivirga salmonicida]